MKEEPTHISALPEPRTYVSKVLVSFCDGLDPFKMVFLRSSGKLLLIPGLLQLWLRTQASGGNQHIAVNCFPSRRWERGDRERECT
jgi:hypothetical protein